MTPRVAKFSRLSEVADQSVWFDIGQIRDESLILPDDQSHMMRMPYERICLVGADSAGVDFVLAITCLNDYELVQFSFGLLQPSRKYGPYAYKMAENGLKLGALDGYDDLGKENVHGLVAVIHLFLTTINQNGSTAHIPTRVGTPAQQAKRARHGKAPLFDWHTVTIQPKQIKAEPQGSTHASPRMHDRRGHWRSLTSGKQVWVRNCKVGDATKGVVFKDYKL